MEPNTTKKLEPRNCTKHCWECQRRRIVCDGTRPICNKCKTAGVVCSGYEDVKPLKWITPGQVTSKKRRPKAQAPGHDRSIQRSQARNGDKTTIVCNRDIKQTVPRIELKSDVSDIVQAINFYNSCIYPTWVPLKKLVATSWIVPLPLDALHYCPTSLRHILTSCALNYRLQSLPVTSSLSGLELDRRHVNTKYFYHRDLAICALSEAIADEKTRASDATMAAVLTFLFIDIRQSTSNWRYHYDGLTYLIRLRGGYEQLFRPPRHLKILVIYYCIVGVMGNTTTPPHEMADPHLHIEHLELIKELYGDGLYPTLLCPPDLFYILIHINHLRTLPEKGDQSMADLAQSAEVLLQAIETFPYAEWGASVPLAEHALLPIAEIYQCAVMIYCISSLQSGQILPRSAALNDLNKKHHNRLMDLLREGLTSMELRASLVKCMLWPLAIAGTGLRTGTVADRSFVEEQLMELCQDAGASLPPLALNLARRFWTSGDMGWDDCFNKPYVFVT